ncbi:type VI secretion system tip protein VgrG, partial [Pseudomonas sp. C2L12B]|nr:type VI secretion system tip protein VgrG [Pseudomonas typographi]
MLAGGSFIKLDPGGITLVGQIKANGGGAPGMGEGAAPALPTLAQPAEGAPTGKPTRPGGANPPRPAPGEGGPTGALELLVDVVGGIP